MRMADAESLEPEKQGQEPSREAVRNREPP